MRTTTIGSQRLWARRMERGRADAMPEQGPEWCRRIRVEDTPDGRVRFTLGDPVLLTPETLLPPGEQLQLEADEPDFDGWLRVVVWLLALVTVVALVAAVAV